MAQQQKKERKTDSRAQRQQISADIFRPQLAKKKERHPSYAGGDGEQIARAKLLFVEDRLENQHIDGCRVLQEDCVGRCCQFRGEHE